jgi:manganese/zinc/iron transport system permease protein
VHIDQHTVLLGEIAFVWLDTVRVGAYDVPQALLWVGAMCLVNLAFVGSFYKELKLATFDRGLASALGFAPALLFYALLALTSATAVASFDAVGAVLFIAFVIMPPAAAYLLTDRLSRMLVIAAAIAIASSVLGYFAAVLLDVSIGGMVAAVTGVFLVFAFLSGPRYGLIAQEARRWRQRRANEERTLTVHLLTHEKDWSTSPECEPRALRDHLRWGEVKARSVLARTESVGLVREEEGKLRLTERGRQLAREVLEPWRAERAR